MTEKNYSVFSIRNCKGYTEEYYEDDYSTLAEAREVADKLYDHLTTRERKYNTVEVRIFNGYEYETLYKR